MKQRKSNSAREEEPNKSKKWAGYRQTAAVSFNCQSPTTTMQQSVVCKIEHGQEDNIKLIILHLIAVRNEEMKKHVILTLVTMFGWLFFYLIGLPFDYFVNTPTLYKILILWITIFSVFPVITFILLSFLEGDYLHNSLWFALYASFGIFLLDFIIVGILQQNGLGFLKTHWLQTLGYIEALVIIPLIGFAIRKFTLRQISNDK